jgi:hypothetical protein
VHSTPLAAAGQRYFRDSRSASKPSKTMGA